MMTVDDNRKCLEKQQGLGSFFNNLDPNVKNKNANFVEYK